MPERRALNRHHSPPAMAKPSRQRFPLLQRECSPRPAGIVASMSEPAGRVFRRDRRTRGARELWRAGAAAGAFGDFRRHKKVIARRARPGQSPPTAALHKPNGKDQRPWTPACAGATNRVRMPCQKRRRWTPSDNAIIGSARCNCRQWRNRAGSRLPLDAMIGNPTGPRGQPACEISRPTGSSPGWSPR